MKNVKAFLVATLLGTIPAFASPLTFSSRAAFDSAAGATSLITFNGLSGGEGAFSITQGDVTFTNGQERFFVLAGNYYGDGLTSDYLNNNFGSENLGISFANPVYAFGMDFGMFYSWDGDSNLQLTLSSGEVYNMDLGAILYDTGAGTLSFFGVVSDVAITSVGLVDSSRGMIIDNFAYSASASAVPDAGSTALFLALSAMGLGLVRRRA